MSAAPLEVKELGKRFPVGGGIRNRPHVHAVEDVSFELRPGTITALVGESGSGKSTVARLLAHLYEANSGEVLFEGNDVSHVRKRRDVLRYRCHTGHAFTRDSLIAEQTTEMEDALYSAVRAVEEKALVLRKLATIGTVMHVTAHPDDEPNGLMAMQSRGLGLRVVLATATSYAGLKKLTGRDPPAIPASVMWPFGRVTAAASASVASAPTRSTTTSAPLPPVSSVISAAASSPAITP